MTAEATPATGKWWLLLHSALGRHGSTELGRSPKPRHARFWRLIANAKLESSIRNCHEPLHLTSSWKAQTSSWGQYWTRDRRGGNCGPRGAWGHILTGPGIPRTTEGNSTTAGECGPGDAMTCGGWQSFDVSCLETDDGDHRHRRQIFA